MKNLASDSDLKKIVRELCEGKELAKQLQTHLNLQPSSSSSSFSSSHESREFLLHRILHSYDQALSILTRNELSTAGGGGEEAPPPPLPTSESPWSIIGSPQSEDSDQDLTDQASRKRKGSVNVKVKAEVGVEGQLDDGYGWRKYGQKDILGAKYPRGYYRCTYRHAHGCLATKHVQRSDEDPTIYEITYRRKHTCDRVNANSSANNPPVPTSNPQSEGPNPLTHNTQNEPPFNIQTSLTNTNPFNFSSSPPVTNPQNNSNIFSNHSDDLGNYYPNPINDLSDNFGQLIPNLRHSDSELSPIIAAVTTTATNSPTLDTGYPFGPYGFGSGFDFGNFGHYP